MNISAFELAQRFGGVKEVSGKMSNPQILAMLTLDDAWPKDDEVPWCSAFVNYIAWLLRLPRSKKLNARSWLNVGIPISVHEAKSKFDIVILKRGDTEVPDDDINAPGHVGFFAGIKQGTIFVLGGNQGDSINVSSYMLNKVIGVRRLYEEV